MGALSLYATREGTEEKGPEAVLLFEHGTKLEVSVPVPVVGFC